MNLNLSMFCILCLCIILCATRKASENLTFVLKQSRILSSVFAVIIICCLAAMKKTVEQITLDLFQDCDVPEEVSGNFDTEVDLNDDVVYFATSAYILFSAR